MIRLTSEKLPDAAGWIVNIFKRIGSEDVEVVRMEVFATPYITTDSQAAIQALHSMPTE